MNRSRCRIDTRTDNKEPLFQDNPGNWHQKGYTNLDFNVATDDGVAVASAGPYANNLHPAPDR